MLSFQDSFCFGPMSTLNADKNFKTTVKRLDNLKYVTGYITGSALARDASASF